MPKAARFEIVRQDSAGNPIVGAVITPYPQGATVSAGGPTSFTVDDPGSIAAGSSVLGVSADGLTERSGLVAVSSITATNVTTSASIPGMVNNDRIVNSVGFTIYKDEQLNESAGSTVTTDANGYAFGYFHYQPFDYKSVGGTSPLGTAQTKYWFDSYPLGGTSKVQTDYPSGSMVARRYNNTNPMISGDRFVEYQSGGTIKWYVGLNAGLGAVIPAHNVAGLLTIDSGGLAVTAGASSIQALTTTTLSSTTGAFSGLLSANAGLTAVGTTTLVDPKIRRLLADQGTTLVLGDFVISAGWGSTATPVIVGGSTDTSCSFGVTANGAGIGANPTITLTFKDGAYSIAPNIVAMRIKDAFNDQPTIPFLGTALSTTQAQFTFMGTPVAGNQYRVAWIIVGGK